MELVSKKSVIGYRQSQYMLQRGQASKRIIVQANK